MAGEYKEIVAITHRQQHRVTKTHRQNQIETITHRNKQIVTITHSKSAHEAHVQVRVVEALASVEYEVAAGAVSRDAQQAVPAPQRAKRAPECIHERSNCNAPGHKGGGGWQSQIAGGRGGKRRTARAR